MKKLEGIIRISTKGVGYVNTEVKGQAVEVDPNSLNTALHGDRVRILVHPEVRDEQQTGEVEAVLERKKMEFVGIIERENGFFFLVPDDKRMYKDILVSKDHLAGAAPGQKVLVRMHEWHDPKKDPIGEVVTVIGAPGDHNTEMQAILYDKGFRPAFPAEVEEEADKLKVSAAADLAQEVTRRRDFRSTPTFTIDPVDAKDFDDALSYRQLENGDVEVGIHIADVAHYLRPHTKLDREAQKRATSIYLVDRTIPMLPEVLSNDLCSLNPHEDKLTFSAVFTFNSAYEITSEWYGRTVINSARRFTYEEVQGVLESGAGDYASELASLNKIAYKLRADKQAAGAIAFETEEIKFVLDNAGRPIKVVRKVRTDSHLLVEDFMLLANRKVAEFVTKIIGEEARGFVYRIHDQPDTDRLKQLADYIAPLGYRLELGDQGVSSRSLNQLFDRIAGSAEENMIQTAAMRSMAKAIYSLKNIGHYGLAFAHYTHFTSPIRRYPDVMVHRLLDLYLKRERPSEEMLGEYDRMVLHSSQMELQAQEAERDSVRYKQIEFLERQVGRVFRGVISGLAKWGIYVQEEETHAEGMVRLADLKDDYYLFDEKSYSMVGKRSNRRYRLGDEVKIKLIKADVKDRMLDFTFV